MEKYKCVKTFMLPKYDEDESPTEEYAEVLESSVWEYDSGYTGESDVRMYSEDGDDDFGYIDITTRQYGGKYQADIQGNIRRIYNNGKTHLMTPYHKKMSGSQRLVVKLTVDGKPKEGIVIQLIAKTFLGPCPKGCVPYHHNGCQSDNYLVNIGYISKKELGQMTGAASRRRPVVKIDQRGEMTEFYSSAREAARQNFMSYQTVIDRCNGKCKSAFAPDGYAYAWEDKEVSIKHAVRKIELSNGYMPKAQEAQFDF